MLYQLLQSIPQGCNMEKGLGYDDMIGCTKVVSVSTLCSRCSNLAVFLCFMTQFPYEQHIDSLLLVHIYSINTILYSYALPLAIIPYILKSLSKVQPEL